MKSRLHDLQQPTAIPGLIRQRRYALRLRKKRQSALVQASFEHCPTDEKILGEIVGDVSLKVLTCDLKATKKALAASLRRILPQGAIAPCVPSFMAVDRPTWVLRDRHRPAVIPRLVDPTPAQACMPITSVMDEFEALSRREHAYHLLDWIRSSAGFTWEASACVLRARGIAIDEVGVEMVRRARDFWDRSGEFRRLYVNAVQLGQVEFTAGEWGFVDANEITPWLPGIHVPKMHRRTEYLVRLFSEGGGLRCIDFHSRTYLPLFRVPI